MTHYVPSTNNLTIGGATYSGVYTWPTGHVYHDPKPELAYCVVAAVRDLQAAWTTSTVSLTGDKRDEAYSRGVHDVLTDLQHLIAARVLDRLGPGEEAKP